MVGAPPGLGAPPGRVEGREQYLVDRGYTSSSAHSLTLVNERESRWVPLPDVVVTGSTITLTDVRAALCSPRETQ